MWRRTMQGHEPVLVTTNFRGVFFGWLSKKADRAARTIELKNCRNVIYWSGTAGFLGLAANGPEKDSRIGATAPQVLLHEVTSVSAVSDAAAKALADWP